MKAIKTSDGFTVRLIAGTNVVLIALDLSEKKRRGCLGFSIQRTTLGTGGAGAEHDWLQQRIDGKPTSMEQAPLQAFRWEDGAVHSTTSYRYRVVARYSMNQIAETAPSLEVEITTEDTRKPDTAIFFNRGAAQSTAFGAQFGTTDLAKLPAQEVKKAQAWLSNGLEEGLNAFLAGAQGSGSALHAALFEIGKPQLLAHLKEAQERGVEVKIVYQRAGRSGTGVVNTNEEALETVGLSPVGIPCGSGNQNALMHNKFVVRLRDGEAEAVWTGSMNWTGPSIYGQLNYGHTIYDPEVARKYEAYFQILAKDPPPRELKNETRQLSNVPAAVPIGLTPIFFPQPDEQMLSLCGQIAERAQFLFAFNLVDTASQFKSAFVKKLSDPNSLLFYLTGSRDPTSAGLSSGDFPEGSDGVFYVSSTIKRTGMPVGARVLAADLLGSDPILIIGSASLSHASVTRNHENILLIRGNTAAADIYFTELMYAFDRASSDGGFLASDFGTPAGLKLVLDDSWSRPHYEPGSKRELIRRLFAGTTGELVEQKTSDELPASPEENFRYLAGFSADSGGLGQDRLGIKDDVQAFAALIASRSLEPPLSIGLFGEWGSGKTFFMNKLRDQVERLSLEMQGTKKMQRDLPFYKRIVQIEFNAWHYMEGNIWASLAEHIIKNLAVRGKEETPNTEMIKLLEEKLKLKEQARLITEQDVNTAQGDVKRANEELETATTELHRKQEELESQRTFLVTKDFLLTKLPKLNEVIQELGLGEAIKSGQDFKSALDNAKQFVNGADPIVTPLMRAKDKTRRRVTLLLILIGAPAVGGLIWYGISQLAPELIAKVSGWITAAGVLLTGGAKWVRRQSTWLKDQIQQVNRIESDYDQTLQAHANRVKDLERERDEKEAKKKEAIDKKEEAEKQEREAKKELERATPANLLAGWLRDRAKQDDYRKHLGLLAIIRRDFDTLSQMMDLVNWRLAPDLAADSEEENPNLTKYKNVKKYENLEAELGEKNTQVSRIVLYIDDLDRCPPEKVVDVLQAVHLLLAFPLFVVVVGVDARWIKQSLKARYRQMLHTDGQIDPEEIYFGKATPDDYLEKIFQIPFWLKPMDEQSSWQLIQGLLTPAIDDKKKTAPADLSDAPVLGRSEDADEEQEQLTAETAGDARSEEPLATVPETEEGKVEERTPAEEMETESPARESQKAEGEVSDEHAEQMQIKVELAARRLEITEAELKFMEQLSPLLGRSPRALKRFVNVYRLIKVSQPSGTLKAFLNPSVNDGHVLVDSTRDNLGPTPEKNEAEMIADYQSVLFLLAVDTGLPDLAGDFFAALEHEDITGDGKSKEGLKAQLKGLEDKLKLTTASEDRGVLDEQRVKLREWLASNGPDNKNGFLCHATGLRRLSVCAKRVARFSFQAYGTGQPEPDRPLRKTSRKKS